MIKRLKQLPDLGWQGVGEACSSSPEDHSLPWLSICHFLKENSHTHCLHMSTHTDFSAHYQPTNSNSFIQSKLFFCHSSPWATTLLSLAFPCACLLSLCDLLLQEHALTWCSIRSSKYSNNFHLYPNLQSLIFSLLYNSFLDPPLGCTSEPKTQQVCCISSRHTLHLI